MKNVSALVDKNGISMEKIDDSIELAKNWVLYSGIQNYGKRCLVNGAFNSWYDVDNKIYPYVYSEVSGYGISFYLYLESMREDNELLERAILSADWIHNYALIADTFDVMFRFYYHENDFWPRNSYSFDNAIILNGLVLLFNKTKNEKYLDISTKIAKRLIDVMQHDNGSFYSYYSLDDGIKLMSPDSWSKYPGSYHAKNAIALLKLFEITGDSFFKNSATKVCDWSLKQQQNDGRFVSVKTDESTILHPHCYSLEGLFYAGAIMDNDDYLQSVIKGIDWIIKSQLDTGGISSTYVQGKFLPTERCDALAQSIRLIILALNRGLIGEEYIESVLKMGKRLLQFQCRKPGLAQRGGFYYMINGDNIEYNNINSWATMFSVQALIILGEFLNSEKNFDINFLL